MRRSTIHLKDLLMVHMDSISSTDHKNAAMIGWEAREEFKKCIKADFQQKSTKQSKLMSVASYAPAGAGRICLGRTSYLLRGHSVWELFWPKCGVRQQTASLWVLSICSGLQFSWILLSSLSCLRAQEGQRCQLPCPKEGETPVAKRGFCWRGCSFSSAPRSPDRWLPAGFL